MKRLVNILLFILFCEYICAQSQVDIVEKDPTQLKTGTMIGPEDPYYFGGFISPVRPFEHLEHSLTDRLRLSAFVYPNSWGYRESGTSAAGLVATAVENSLGYFLEQQLKKQPNKNWFTSALLLGRLSK